MNLPALLLATLALGVAIGWITAPEPKCRRGCCAVRQDPGLPPTKPHTAMHGPWQRVYVLNPWGEHPQSCWRRGDEHRWVAGLQPPQE